MGNDTNCTWATWKKQSRRTPACRCSTSMLAVRQTLSSSTNKKFNKSAENFARWPSLVAGLLLFGRYAGAFHSGLVAHYDFQCATENVSLGIVRRHALKRRQGFSNVSGITLIEKYNRTILYRTP